MKTKYISLLGSVLLYSQLMAQSIIYQNAYEDNDLSGRQIDEMLPVGKTNGNSSVSPTGAFTYSVPIEMPPGTNNMEPELALSYSSQATNGIAGYGWNLEGLSSIKRVFYTHFHNGRTKNIHLDLDDPLALDGNRLMLLSGNAGQNGTVYGTEAEMFMKITLHGQFGNGPEWIEVETKDGIKIEYGKSESSKVLSHDLNHIIEWKKNRVMDRNGNYIDYLYETIAKEHVIREISYTGNLNNGQLPYVHVLFNYGIRQDQNVFYTTEYAKEQVEVNLIKSIEINYGEEAKSYKRYELNYSFDHFSFLSEIHEFGKEQSTDQYNSLRFNYWKAGKNYHEISTGLVTSTSDCFIGDFNGDGSDDVFRANYTVNSNNQKTYTTFDVFIREGNNFKSPVLVNFTGGAFSGIGLNSDYILQTGIIGINVGDFNGDGLSDVAIAYANGTGIPYLSPLRFSHISIHYTSPGSTVPLGQSFSLQPNVLYNYIGLRNALVVADFNGDGADDIYVNTHDGFKPNDPDHIDNTYYPQLFLPRLSYAPILVHGIDHFSNSKFSSKDEVYVLDLNGNGKANIMQVFEHADVNRTTIRELHMHQGYATIEVLYQDDQGSNAYANFPSKGHRVAIADFNGDGKSDLLTSSKNDLVNWTIHLSTGRGFLFKKQLVLYLSNPGEHLHIADFNGDRRADILVSTSRNNSTHLDFQLSLGVNSQSGDLNFSIQNEFFGVVIPYDFPAMVADFDGDGIAEISASSGHYSPIIVGDISHDRPYGLLKHISTGFSELSKISYSSLSEAVNDCRSLYIANHSASYPIMDFHQPIFVTNEITQPDGSGHNSSQASSRRIKQRYFYKHAKMHMQGKGFLGFEEVNNDEFVIGDPQGKFPTVFNSTSYEIDYKYFFSRPSKSFSSFITYDDNVASIEQLPNPCVVGQTLDENLTSKELFYSTIPLSSQRFINQLTSEKEGDNLQGYTLERNYDYFSTTSSEHGNPDQIISSRALGSSNQEIETTELQYVNTGTYFPASVREKRISKVRGSLNPVVVLKKYEYDNNNGHLLKEQVWNPTGSGVELETIFTYEPDFGLLVNQQVNVFNHIHPVRISQFEFDLLGRFMKKRINPLGHIETWDYDDLSGKATHYNDPLPNNGIAQFYYDDFHQLIQQRDEFGNLSDYTRKFEIDHSSPIYEPDVSLYSVLQTTEGKGFVKQWYDHKGNIRKVEQTGYSAPTVIVKNYDGRGLLINETDPFFGADPNNISHFEYDVFSRIVEQEVFDRANTLLFNSTTNHMPHTGINIPYNYTNRSTTTTFISPDGSINSIEKDATGRITQSSDQGGVLDYTYDSNGKHTSVSLNGSIVSQMEYDVYGYQKSLVDIDAGQSDYQYNVIGELIYQQDANGNITDNFEYDELGNLLFKKEGGIGFEYEYNHSGNGIAQLKLANNMGNNFSKEYFYTDQGLLMFSDQHIQGQVYRNSYEYDKYGNLSSQEFPSGAKLIYSYSPDSYLTKIEDKDSDPNGSIEYFTGGAQDQFGNLLDYQLLNSTTVSASFDILGLPEEVNCLGVYHRKYEFEVNSGNLLSRENPMRGIKEEFEYDTQNRLKKTSLNGTVSHRSNFNAAGNITSRTTIGAMTYHPTKIHAAITAKNPQGKIQTTDQFISYTPQHNPSTIMEGDEEIIFEYGPFHERKTARFINHGTGQEKTRIYLGQSELEIDVNHQIVTEVEYINGPVGLCGLRLNDFANSIKESYAVFTDHIGSIELIVDKNNAIITEQSFDAWGNLRSPFSWALNSTNPNPSKPWLWRGYTGHEHFKQFQLIHMNGRMYDPLLGRMLSPDNYVQDPLNTQNYNRYSYVLNNPLKFTDPSGEFVWVPFVIGAAIGVYTGGSMANNDFNPGNWNFSSGNTWKGIIGGGIVGGLSGSLGYSVATSGIAFANTAAIAAASMSNSVGTAIYTQGKSDIILGFGFGSFNFNSREFGFLGKPGNSTLENIGYGLGAAANVSDILAGLNPGDAQLNTEKSDKLGHNSITKIGETNQSNSIVSVGPESGGKWILNPFNFRKGTNGWNNYVNAGDDVMKLAVKGLNLNRLNQYGAYLDKGINYNLYTSSCVSHAARALTISGVPAIGIHPFILHTQMALRSIGIRPMLFSPLFYQH